MRSGPFLHVASDAKFAYSICESYSDYMYKAKVLMQLSRKGHNHQAHPFPGTDSRGEELTTARQNGTVAMTNIQRTATEEPQNHI